MTTKVTEALQTFQVGRRLRRTINGLLSECLGNEHLTNYQLRIEQGRTRHDLQILILPRSVALGWDKAQARVHGLVLSV